MGQHHPAAHGASPGHRPQSPRPRGVREASGRPLGAYANLVRDLLEALEEPPGTIVGHSLGGGVALQFAYQFPERCERLVLVSSGGLGREVHPMLRAAVLPGAELVLPMLASGAAHAIGSLVTVMGWLGFRASADLGQAWRSFVGLGDPDARRAFLQTARGVIDIGGQRVSAEDKLYLTEGLPILLVWGERDPLIPVDHALRSHDLIRGSRLDVFAGAGHYPYLEDPERFAALLIDFMESTQPLHFDARTRRDRLKAGPPSSPALTPAPTTPPATAASKDARP